MKACSTSVIICRQTPWFYFKITSSFSCSLHVNAAERRKDEVLHPDPYRAAWIRWRTIDDYATVGRCRSVSRQLSANINHWLECVFVCWEVAWPARNTLKGSERQQSGGDYFRKSMLFSGQDAAAGRSCWTSVGFLVEYKWEWTRPLLGPFLT